MMTLNDFTRSAWTKNDVLKDLRQINTNHQFSRGSNPGPTLLRSRKLTEFTTVKPKVTPNINKEFPNLCSKRVY